MDKLGTLLVPTTVADNLLLTVALQTSRGSIHIAVEYRKTSAVLTFADKSNIKGAPCESGSFTKT